MKSKLLGAAMVLCFGCLIPAPLWGQAGDQILDGIGETGLISRYVLNGHVKDWSRNNLHGTLVGSGSQFTQDEQFGQVLYLPAYSDAGVVLPAEVLNSVESLSVCGWFQVGSGQRGSLFDFGFRNESRFSAGLVIGEEQSLIQARLGGEQKAWTSPSVAAELRRWIHFAVVLDATTGTLGIWLNGKPVGVAEDVEARLEDWFGSQPDDVLLLLGKSLNAGDRGWDVRLHDFRLYRIALHDSQVAGIYQNALKKDEQVVQTRRRREQDLPVFADTTPQLYGPWLVGVDDITIETETGHLPRLPRYLPGIYREGWKGPDVRVIWPSPEDNSQVMEPGRYELTGQVPGTLIRPHATITVSAGTGRSAPERRLEVFKLSEVTLQADIHGRTTKFMQNRNKFIHGLIHTNPDDFLYMFRNAFGQVQPEGARPLKGWDSQETKLRGHATGHYLSALAQAYASTAYDHLLREQFASKMEYMVDVLFELSQLSGHSQTSGGLSVSDPQAVPPAAGKSGYDSDLSEEGIRTDFWNWGAGYISAYPPDQFIMLEQGASYGGDSSKIWAPYYTLHKILAGLMDIYDVSGNEKALGIVRGMGDWVYARLSQVPVETLISMWNRYIAGEFGGMNEAMARLYRITGEDRYLETARLFDNVRVFFGDAEHSHGLAKNVDMFRSLHANQHIPQIMGALEIYRASQQPEYYRIADNFWYKATGDYMYSIGGVAGARNPSNAECFTLDPATLYENGFSAGGQNETCATYNMLKLTRNLFLFEPRGELMDYYERGLYNHILASVDEHTPANTYHVPLRAGSVKHFGNPDMDGFSCCNGTALESSTKLQNSIYFKSQDNRSLYVNLFIPSAVNWTERKITVTQKTAFPSEETTRLIINGKGAFDLHIRVPGWADQGFVVLVNGQVEQTDAVPGTYVTISRKWKSGDVVDVRMPFSFRLEPVMDQQNIASLFYGPVLLAAQEPEPRQTWRKVSLNARDVGKTISGDPQSLEFVIDGIVYKPFYETYGRHSVYLDVTLTLDEGL